jgi:ABC-type glycerol-3-phosphate transport system substrate-binding protein
MQTYPDKYGLENMRTFGASFGNFASPQNPFLSGQVAMEIQGVWMYNFIDKYAPTLEWGAAPFPSKYPDRLPMVTLAECDTLVIPKGSPHPEGAFEFIKYVNTQKAMEKLNLAQRKFSPLKEISPDFVRKHPNPEIEVFIELAHSENACYASRLSLLNEYLDEMRVAVDQVMNLINEPEPALDAVQKRVQWRFDRVMRRWDMVKEERLEEWRQ